MPRLSTAAGVKGAPFTTAGVRARPPSEDSPVVSISDNQRVPLASASWADTVYHGRLPDLLQPFYDPEGYLAFLGRLSPEKGAKTILGDRPHGGPP